MRTVDSSDDVEDEVLSKMGVGGQDQENPEVSIQGKEHTRDWEPQHFNVHGSPSMVLEGHAL